jgi:thiol-disulfide isomerase/thioredoxin
MQGRTSFLAAIAFSAVCSALHAYADDPPKADSGSVKPSERQLRDYSPEEQEQLRKATTEKRNQPHPFKIGDGAPRLQVARWTDGKVRSLNDFRGKVVVVEFTASWCVPCRASAPIMKSLAAKYGDRVAWVGVTSAEATNDELKQWLDKDKWPPLVGVDQVDRDNPRGLTAKNYGVIGVPHIVVIDPYGRISHCDELWVRTPSSAEETEKLYAAMSKFLGRKWPPNESEKLSTEEFIVITKKLEEFRTTKFIDEALAKKRPN